MIEISGEASTMRGCEEELEDSSKTQALFASVLRVHFVQKVMRSYDRLEAMT